MLNKKFGRGKETLFPRPVTWSFMDAERFGEFLGDFILRLAVESGIQNWLIDRLPPIRKEELDYTQLIQTSEAQPLSLNSDLGQGLLRICFYATTVVLISFTIEVLIPHVFPFTVLGRDVLKRILPNPRTLYLIWMKFKDRVRTKMRIMKRQSSFGTLGRSRWAYIR